MAKVQEKKIAAGNGKVHEIQGVEFHIKKLKFGQMRQIVKLLKDLGINPQASIIDAIDKIFDERFSDVMRIAFPEIDHSKIDYDEVDFDDIYSLVSDFLSANGTVRSLLLS
jgi:hypothetical protein